MKKEDAEILLKHLTKFASLSTDDLRIQSLGSKLTLLLLTRGLLCTPAVLTAKQAKNIHARINEDLGKIEGSRDFSEVRPDGETEQHVTEVSPEGRVAIMANTYKGQMVVDMHLDGDVEDSLMFFMHLLMMIVDVKKIIRCKGCGIYFFRTKGKKLSCSDTCRQRIKRGSMTPEEIEQRRKKERDKYKKWVLGGKK